jgi:hypothetical protein
MPESLVSPATVVYKLNHDVMLEGYVKKVTEFGDKEVVVYMSCGYIKMCPSPHTWSVTKQEAIQPALDRLERFMNERIDELRELTK